MQSIQPQIQFWILFCSFGEKVSVTNVVSQLWRKFWFSSMLWDTITSGKPGFETTIHANPASPTPSALIVKHYKANSFPHIFCSSMYYLTPCLWSLQLSNCSLNAHYLFKSWFQGTFFSHWSSILPLVCACICLFNPQRQGNVTDIRSIIMKVVNTVLYRTTSSGHPIWTHLFVPHACY